MAGIMRNRPPMWSRKQRLTTLDLYWQNPEQSPMLAKAGFYMKDGCLRCAYCTHAMPLDEIRAGADPMKVHARVFPQCAYLMKRMGTLRINAENGATTPNTEVTPWGRNGPVCCENVEDATLGHPTGIFKSSDLAFKPPQYETMAEPEARMDSFRNLPERDRENIPKVESLVRAGFMLKTAVNENSIVTKCYYCDVEVNNLEPCKDPMVEHVRHSPRCWHVILSIGEQDVRDITTCIREDFRGEADGNDELSSNNSHSRQNSEPEPSLSDSPPCCKRPCTAMAEPMTSDSPPCNVRSCTMAEHGSNDIPPCCKRPYTAVAESGSNDCPVKKSKQMESARASSSRPNKHEGEEPQKDLRLKRKRKLVMEQPTSEPCEGTSEDSLAKQLAAFNLSPRDVMKNRGSPRYSADECCICRSREDIYVQLCCQRPVCSKDSCQKLVPCPKGCQKWD